MVTVFRKGFTLIELLIVVAIIAILAAIAVPNFLEAQTRAKVTSALANDRNIATACEAYRIDNRGSLPNVTWPDIGGQPWYVISHWYADRYWYHISLSTPVAYMTSVPEDRFQREYWLKQGASSGYYLANLIDYNIMKAIKDAAASHTIPACPGIWNWDKALEKCGTIDAAVATIWGADGWSGGYNIWFTSAGKLNANYCFAGFGPNFKEYNQCPMYDPSNGTISVGSVCYFN
jgi:prepilin-type N-terminal cleavage/methylation domain-containing protein